MKANAWIVAAGIIGALGVLIGAFGAHGLPGWLESSGLDSDTIAKRMETFETGVRYHMYHAAALIALGLLARERTTTKIRFAGLGFVAGIIIFSGLLYVLALTGLSWLGAIVPLGGVSFIVGWVCVAIAGFDAESNEH